MISYGKFNTLAVIRIDGEQLFLDGAEQGEIPLIDQNYPENVQLNDLLKVFVFKDGKNQLQATLKTPKAQVDEVAWLQVVSLSHAGAFLDWGLPKDLLTPFSEQNVKMVEGRHYLVRLFLDENNRIAASTLLDDFIQDTAFYLKEGDEVNLMIADQTELGVKAIINHKYWGVLYKNEIFQNLQKGQNISGYIKKIRADNKIDLTLNCEKYGQKVDATSEKLLDMLQAQGGFMAVTDKSPPKLIYDSFGVSKKVFKQSIGSLYKQRKIVIEENGIRIV
jgi:predicted RNA-binding protein (virulence factor B family)